MSFNSKSLRLLGILTAIAASSNIAPAWADTSVTIDPEHSGDICIDLGADYSGTVQVSWGNWLSNPQTFDFSYTPRHAALQMRAYGGNVPDIYIIGANRN